MDQLCLDPLPNSSSLSYPAHLELQGLLPRGICALLHEKGWLPTFQFSVIGSCSRPRPHPREPSLIPLIEEMKHMRTSALVTLPDPQDPSNFWELHLKVNPTGHELDGWVIHPLTLRSLMLDQVWSLFQANKLPLILDLDDTIVRVMNPGPSGKKQAHPTSLNSRVDDASDPEESTRSHWLPCGKRVMVARDAARFLDWATMHFEVSVYSLGEQMYVDQICDLLDPQGTRIQGLRFSARQEYNYVSQGGKNKAAVLRHPVKCLGSMYAFAVDHPFHPWQYSSCTYSKEWAFPKPMESNSKFLFALTRHLSQMSIAELTREFIGEVGKGFALPIILEDQYRPWPTSHHDNIILVNRTQRQLGPSNGSQSVLQFPPWDVEFFPIVTSLLDRIHKSFFKRLTSWAQQCEIQLSSVTSVVNTTDLDFFRSALSNTPMPSPPTVINCYKEHLKEMLRAQISQGNSFSVPKYWDQFNGEEHAEMVPPES
jgi:hypothetical protein